MDEVDAPAASMTARGGSVAMTLPRVVRIAALLPVLGFNACAGSEFEVFDVEAVAGATAEAVSGAGGLSSSGGASGGGLAMGSVSAATAGMAPLGAAGVAGSSSAAGTGAGGVGGAGGTGHGASGAAGAPYQPCPSNGDTCKILPLGDSITWGIQYDGAYRVQLFDKALKAGQKLTFTGSVSNGPSLVANVPFPKSNEGHSGWTIAQIAGLVPNPAFDNKPHIVLLMIGTNDIYAPSGQAEMPKRLGSLLDEITAAAPEALLVVAKLTPLSSSAWNANIETYNDAIPALVASRAAAGKHIRLGDMNTGFTPAMLSTDTVHPNKAGYDFMGNAWYSLIGELLPK